MNEIMHNHESTESSHSTLDEALGEFQMSKSLDVNNLRVEIPSNIIEDMGVVSKSLVDKLSELSLELTRKYFAEAEKRVSESNRIAEQQKEKAAIELNQVRNIVAILEQKLSASISENIRLSQLLESERKLYRQRCTEIEQLKEKIQVDEQISKRKDEEIECKLSKLESAVNNFKLSLDQELEVTSANFKMLEGHLCNAIALEKELSFCKEKFLSSYTEFSKYFNSIATNNYEKIDVLNSDLTSLRNLIASEEESENENENEVNLAPVEISNQSNSFQEKPELPSLNILSDSEIVKNTGLYTQKHETLNLNG